MSVSNVLTGFLTGFPVMAVVGPIALLLIEAGLERGVRGAYPAALGVTAADSTFALGAALVGVAAVEVLEPVRSWLALAAVVVLVVLAVRLVLGAVGQLRALVPAPEVPVAVGGSSVVPRAVEGGHPGGGAAVTGPVTSRLAVAGGFFGLTALNPVTIAVFAAIVLSGSRGVGTAGWVMGMAAASLVVNLGFVLVGHGLGAVLEPAAVAWVRLGAAALIVAMALHFALGAA
jgi:threonine/homoserine/homoserine lactone efflux protein